MSRFADQLLFRPRKVQHTPRIFTNFQVLAINSPKSIDRKMINDILDSALRQKNHVAALSIYYVADRLKLKSDSLYDTVLTLLADSGDINETIGVFHSISKPQINAFNHLLNAFAKAGQIEQMDHAYNRLLESKIKPDVDTYRALMNGYERAKMFDKLFSIFDTVVESKLVDCSVFCLMIQSYRKRMMFSEIDDIVALVDLSDIEYDVQLYENLLTCYTDQRELKKFEKLYIKLVEQRLPLNKSIYLILITHYGSKGEFARMYEILERMTKASFIPDTIVYNMMISAYSQFSRLGEINELIQRMKANEIPLDLDTFKILFQTLSDQKKYKELVELYNSNIPKTHTNNLTIVNCYLEACNQLGMIDEMERLLTFKAYSKLDTKSFNQYIEAYCGIRSMKKIQKMVGMMHDKNIQPDVHTFRCLLKAYSKDINQYSDVISLTVQAYLDQNLGLIKDREMCDLIIQVIPDSAWETWRKNCIRLKLDQDASSLRNALNIASILKNKVWTAELCNLLDRISNHSIEAKNTI